MKFTLIFVISVFCIINWLTIGSDALPFPNSHNDPTVKEIGTITEMPDIHLPKNITIPDGIKFKFLLSAYGVQIYKCFGNNHNTPNNWTLVTPDAYCINDKYTQTFTPAFEVVYHYFLPEPINGGRVVYESLVKGDDSLIVTNAIAQSASPDGPKNIPWLLTEVTHHEGKGRFSDISHVIRVNTQEGVAPPVEQCGTFYPDGEMVPIYYRTDYWFLN